MTIRKKLIEVALPLEAINEASAREKSIRHGHPSTLHLWWARRPLAAARAVIFTSLVDDPDDPNALPAFVEACRQLPVGANVHANGDTPRMRLFDFIERLVTWEATTDEAILTTARELIQIATEGNPPPLLDPFAGGGSIPLEAQRLGLEAHASDLNPVAVMINKAQIEIPPRFANMPPVNPRDREKMFGSLSLTPKSPLPQGARGLENTTDEHERITIPPQLQGAMKEIARTLRREQTASEELLWQALRNRQLDDRKFRRQQPVGAFVLDFYCADERLAVEVDGPIHDDQREADAQRQEILESLGIRFVRVTSQQVETDIPSVLATIRAAFLPSPLRGRGAGGEGDTTWRGAAGLAADVRYYGEWMREKAWEKIGHLYPPLTLNPSPTRGEGREPQPNSPLSALAVGEGQGERGKRSETVIAWLWARTVKSPNPAVNAHVPLVRSFILSKKKGKECWAKPVVEAVNPSPLNPLSHKGRGDLINDIDSPSPAGEGSHRIRFEVVAGKPVAGQEGTTGRQYGGARCIISGEPIPWDYIREEGKAGRMGVMLMAIVTEGHGGRSYYSPSEAHENIAHAAAEMDFWKPGGEMPLKHRNFQPPVYGMYEYGDLFTPRQLVALTTFSDLVGEAREQIRRDALAAGMAADDVPLAEGGRGARAYAEAVSVYLAFAVDRSLNYWATLATWLNQPKNEIVGNVFGRQALPMVWDYAEANPFSNSGGNWTANLEYLLKAVSFLPSGLIGNVVQQDAAKLDLDARTLSTDPPYYDNIGYADLSDYFYVWMRKSLREVYPEIFGTMLVPKEPELIASPYRHGGKEAANAHFEGGMLQTFRNIRRFITPEYPLTVYYAFKQQDAEAGEEDEEEPLTLNPSPTRGEGLENDDDSPSPRSGRGDRGVRGAVASTGWETMLSSLIEAGFSIDGTWPVRTERSGRMIGNGTNALASSIVLVCRARAEDAATSSRRAFVDMLRRELPDALKEMQSGNIAPVDLAQASIGPGMAIYSRYSKVLEADGSAMSVRTALGLINAALDEYLAEQDGNIDPDTRFAVAWFEQFGFEEGEFGRSDVLARAKNTSVAGVEAAGLVESGRGKVRLIHWRDYDPGAWDPTQDKRPTVWEATHHLIEQLNSHGELGSAMLLNKMAHDLAAEARQLAYRLYSICERKGWADHARDYNALVVSWSGIGEVAAEQRQAADQGQARRQGRLFED